MSERVIFKMRQPCTFCTCPDGYIEPRNGQACVRCKACGQFQYNAPKTETGEKPRSVSTVHEAINPRKRARILERATGRCEICGSPRNINVGHLLSVKQGMAHGLTELELNHDENLAAMCEECNLGLGQISVSPRLYVALLLRRVND